MDCVRDTACDKSRKVISIGCFEVRCSDCKRKESVTRGGDRGGDLRDMDGLGLSTMTLLYLSN